MKTKTVYTPDYILLIDEDATIKHGDYLLEKDSIINIFPDYLTDLGKCQKIIGYLPNKIKSNPLGNVPTLQPQLFEVLKLANEEPTTYAPNFDKIFRVGFVIGFNKAKELFGFSLEDMERCFESVAQNVGTSVKQSDLPSFSEYIQTIQQPKQFIPEYELVGQCNCPCHRGSGMRHIAACCHPQKILKIIDNQIIGEWK